MSYSVERYHDFSAGHRVAGHENKCAQLHGHNYRIIFRVRVKKFAEDQPLDDVGRVVDFSCIKETLCKYLEDFWDHKFLLWSEDPLWDSMGNWRDILFSKQSSVTSPFIASWVKVPFNPTAENMAEYLVTKVAPRLLGPYGVELYSCTVEETRKCSATFAL